MCRVFTVSLRTASLLAQVLICLVWRASTARRWVADVSCNSYTHERSQFLLVAAEDVQQDVSHAQRRRRFRASASCSRSAGGTTSVGVATRASVRRLRCDGKCVRCVWQRGRCSQWRRCRGGHAGRSGGPGYRGRCCGQSAAG